MRTGPHLQYPLRSGLTLHRHIVLQEPDQPISFEGHSIVTRDDGNGSSFTMTPISLIHWQLDVHRRILISIKVANTLRPGHPFDCQEA